jgi:hypothetical protein
LSGTTAVSSVSEVVEVDGFIKKIWCYFYKCYATIALRRRSTGP